jgi:hypothetical protein
LSLRKRKRKGQSVAPKILFLDIEWRPTKALVWGAWQQNILPPQILEDGGLFCVGAKWYGSKETFVFSEWEHGHVGMLERTVELMNDADLIVGYNSDKYDLPKLEGEFILHGIPLPPKVASVDLMKTVKKLGYFMNRLAFIAPYLGIGSKMENEGFLFWRRVMEGDEKSQAKMEKYCAQDVKLTEKLYDRIKPAIRNHPALHGKDCPECGSAKAQKRGWRPTRTQRIQRLHCQNCGHWYEGDRKKI